MLIGLLIILLFLGFIIYKFAILQKYKTEKIAIDNKSIFNETMNINYNQTNNTIVFEEMVYFDCFSDYVTEENVAFKVKYNENGEISSFYNIVRQKQYISALNINSFMLMSDNLKDKGEVNYSTVKSMKNFLNKNQIKDDIDLIKYIKNNYYLNNNLFTPSTTMKNNYIINTFTQVALPEFKSITLINGDEAKGYIINIKSIVDIKEIHLLHNDNQYIITLSGYEITNTEFISNLLESINFN